MNRLLIAFWVMLLSGSAWAQPSLSAVADNTALKAATGASYPNGVYRTTFGNNNGAVPQFYVHLTGTCAANSYTADNGQCVNANDGNSWLARWSDGVIDGLQFGPIADGTTDNASRIANGMKAACALGAKYTLAPGTYAMTTRTTITTCAKGLTVDLPSGVVFDMSGGPTDMIMFRFDGAATGDYALTANAATGDPTVQMSAADGANFAVGDLIELHSDVVFDGQEFSKLGEMAKVLSLSTSGGTTTIALQAVVRSSHSYLVSDNAKARRIAPLRNITWRGGKIVGLTDPSTSSQGFLDLRYVENAKVSGWYTYNVQSTAIVFVSAYGFEAKNGRCEYQLNEHSGYCVAFGGSARFGLIADNQAYSVLQAYMQGTPSGFDGQARDVTIARNISAGSLRQGAAGHSGFEFLTIERNYFTSCGISLVRECIVVNGGTTRVLNNVLADAPNNGIYYRPDTLPPIKSSVEISGNYITGSSIGIIVGPQGPSAEVEYVDIGRNNIIGTTSRGIYINWNNTKAIVNCRIADQDIFPASGPTIEITTGNICHTNPYLHPGYKPNRWYPAVDSGTVAGSGGVVGAADTIYCHAAQIGAADAVVNSLGIQATAVGTAAAVKLAVYATDYPAKRPGMLLASTGAISINAVGAASGALGAATRLPKGSYWLCSLWTWSAAPSTAVLTGAGDATYAARVGGSTVSNAMWASIILGSTYTSAGLCANGFPATLAGLMTDATGNFPAIAWKQN